MRSQLTRRDMLRTSLAATALALGRLPASALGLDEPEEGATLVPFLDPQPTDPKRPMLQWDQLSRWITPEPDLFAVSHYGTPTVDAEKWSLDITGLVRKQKSLALDQIKTRPRREIIATLECSGNGASARFMGAVGNVKWTGTPLGPLLRECGVKDDGIEIVFFGADQKTEKIRDQEYSQNFARSLSTADALSGKVLLAYEMNGKPLSAEHGFPMRLVVPGWYGIAWVKWLNRIEVHDRRYMSKFMAREYVTIRGEEEDGQTTWRETSVSLMNVKSIVARVVRLKGGHLRVSGAAWSNGAPIKTVELQINGGPWRATQLDQEQKAPYAWTFWSYDWKNPSAGEHTLVSRASDQKGRTQPSAEDPAIKLKKTYWEANQQYPRKIQL